MTKGFDEDSYYNVQYIDYRDTVEVISIRARNGKEALDYVKCFVAHKKGTARLI